MYTKDDVTKAYKELPAVVRTTIENSNWEEKLNTLLKKFSLRIDQVSILENNIVFVMVGLMSVSDFVTSLREDADIKERVDELVADIDTEIFSPIREVLISKAATADNIHEQSIRANVPAHAVLESRDDILKQIEDPTEIPVPQIPITQTQDVAAAYSQVDTDEITIPQNTTVVTEAPITPSQPPRVDPYREPIE